MKNRITCRQLAIILALGIAMHFPALWASPNPPSPLTSEETPLGQVVACVPTEIWRLIFRELPARALLKSSLVCRKFQELSTEQLNTFLQPLELDAFKNAHVARWKLLQILSSQEFVRQLLGIQPSDDPIHPDEYTSLFGQASRELAPPLTSSQRWQELGGDRMLENILYPTPEKLASLDMLRQLDYEGPLYLKLRHLFFAYWQEPAPDMETLDAVRDFIATAKSLKKELYTLVDRVLDIKKLCHHPYSPAFIKTCYRIRNGNRQRGLQGFTQAHPTAGWIDNKDTTYEQLKTTHPDLYRIASAFLLFVPGQLEQGTPSNNYYKSTLSQIDKGQQDANLLRTKLLLKRLSLYGNFAHNTSLLDQYLRSLQRPQQYFSEEEGEAAHKLVCENILNPAEAHLGTTQQHAILAQFMDLLRMENPDPDTAIRFLKQCLASEAPTQRLSAAVVAYTLITGDEKHLPSCNGTLVNQLSDVFNAQAKDPVFDVVQALSVLHFNGLKDYHQPLPHEPGFDNEYTKPVWRDSIANNPTMRALLTLRGLLDRAETDLTWDNLRKLIAFCKVQAQDGTSLLYQSHLLDRLPDLLSKRITQVPMLSTDCQAITELCDILAQHPYPQAQALGIDLRSRCVDQSSTPRPYLKPLLSTTQGPAFYRTLILWMRTMLDLRKDQADIVQGRGHAYQLLLKSLNEF